MSENEMKNAIELIAAERQRQQDDEMWTPDHDDEHDAGELAKAAACYAIADKAPAFVIGQFWPWDEAWWKPSPDNRVRDLVKAGALIVAEIERLQRKA